MELIKELCDCYGVSGYEKSVIKLIFDIIDEQYCDEKYIDSIGNLIVKKCGINHNKSILVCAHVDEVGFQVISNMGDGKCKIKPIGNVKTWNANQQRVINEIGVNATIYADNTENLKAYNYENMNLKCLESNSYVDVGDVFTYSSKNIVNDRYIIGKALDNRVGCYCLIRNIMSNIVPYADVYYCFSVQEEIGMRGIRVAKTQIAPNECIVVDCSSICERNSLELGKGVGIKISDCYTISSQELVDYAKKQAKENNVNYQMEVSDCGTTELIMTNEVDNGYKSIGLSIPCEYMHSANSVVSINDVQECISLLSHMLT